MTEIAIVLFQNFAMILMVMLMLWLLSLWLGDVSFIDSFWAFGFVLIAGFTFLMTATTATTATAMTIGGDRARSTLLLVVTTVWGLRLSGYLFLRWWREGADGRYVAMQKRFEGNVPLAFLRKVFLLQGCLLWLVSWPVQLGMVQPEPAGLGPLAWLGTTCAVVGIAFESISDAQLARFKRDPANAGRVMDRGLWRYSRHPNYFGDLCVWWGLFLIASETPAGRVGVVGPLLLTWILVQWSGATLLERRLHRSRPGYAEYVDRTSRFIPWPPRRAER